jgi:hypothetical protein
MANPSKISALVLSSLSLLALEQSYFAQNVPAAAASAAVSGIAGGLAPIDTWPPPAFRIPGRASGYALKSSQQAHLELQVLSQAMLVRDICANPSYTDEQVNRHLAGIARMTRRQETCQSIWQYSAGLSLHLASRSQGLAGVGRLQARRARPAH